jgi:hypothetical protein
MFQKHSISGRVAIGKTSGFLLGGVAFVLLPIVGAETSVLFDLGIWLMSTLMGVMIGFMGVFATHPIFGFRMPFYVRGAIVGASFFLLLPLLAMEEMMGLMQLEMVQWFNLTSPWWVVFEGALWGVLIGWVATKWAGEGELPVT